MTCIVQAGKLALFLNTFKMFTIKNNFPTETVVFFSSLVGIEHSCFFVVVFRGCHLYFNFFFREKIIVYKEKKVIKRW